MTTKDRIRIFIKKSITILVLCLKEKNLIGGKPIRFFKKLLDWNYLPAFSNSYKAPISAVVNVLL